MQILIKVLLITVSSNLLALLFLDYDNTQVELNLSSKINCININSASSPYYVCNTCFKVNPKGKVN